MADKTAARGLTLVFLGAALLGLTGCGGGGADTAPLASGDPSPAPAPLVVPAPAPAPAPVSAIAPGAIAPAPAATTTPPPAPEVASASAPTLGACELFPATAIFNTRIDDVSRFPAHAQSAAWIARVGAGTPFQADWSSSDNPADATSYFGLPINVVDGTPATTDWAAVSFDFATSGISMERGYPDRSDCAVASGSGFAIARSCESLPAGQRLLPFPLPSRVLSQGGTCNDPKRCGDHHLLVVEQGACRLWESFFSYRLSNQWYTVASAAWDLRSLALRPFNWGASNAAGLPITPLLAKAAEASSGEVRHALSVAFRDQALALAVSWPARFAAGGDDPGAIPFGALLRLKAGFVIPDGWTVQARALATAARRYGMYVSDNGADFHVGGEPNAAWDPRTLQQLRSITMSQMEFVDLKAITGDPRFSPDSMAASW